jgi:hypothetical protein
MAKTVNLTVKVDDTQFKQFIRNFNAFTGQIKNLNMQFSQIHTTIQKTTAATNILSSIMKGLWNTTKSLLGTVAGITTHFIKWGTLIGGISALLGMGGGLFGIERLAAAILQKRKQVMGLGGDFGRTQAAQIFGQGVIDNPTGVLEGIRMGLGGSTDQLRALTALGVPFGTKEKPEDLLPKILERVQDIVKRAPAGTELATAKAFGADALGLTDMDITRLKTMSREEVRNLAKKIIEQGKELSLSEKAQKAWADLELQFKAAKTAMMTIFGEKIADLAEPLEKLSEGFVNLVKTLMHTPIVEKIIRQITKWLNQFADYLKSEDLKKDLEKLSEEAEKWIPILREFKENLLQFADIVGKVARGLGYIWNFISGLNPSSSDVLNRLQQYQRDQGGGASAPSTVPPAVSPPMAPSGGGFTPVPQGTFRELPPSPPASGGKQGFMYNQGGSQLAQFFGGGSLGGSTGGIALGGTSVGGSRSLAAFGGTNNLGINNTRLAWQGATQRAVPGDNIRGSALHATANMNFADNRRGARGALETDNWQMSRTTQLVVRNVPGSNMFATGNMMG